MASQGDRAALAAMAFAVVCFAAAMNSGAITSAAKGNIGRDLSLVTVLAALGVWALGALSDDRVRMLLPTAFAAGVALSGAFAVLEVLLQVESGPIQLIGGRPPGLTPNPVYFGALCAGALTCSIWHEVRVHRTLTVASIALFAFLANLSGSRAALFGAVAIGILLIARQPWRTIFRVGTGLVGGIIAAFWFVSLWGQSGDSLSRVSSNRGLDGRWQVWLYGWESFLERPVLGWGLGRFRAAIQHHFSPEFVAQNALYDQRQAWFDPHNVVVLIAVGAGILGLVTAASFLVLAVKRTSGPGVWMFWAVAAAWLLQPVSIATFPVAMLLLGSSRTAPISRRPELSKGTAVVAAAVAAMSGAWFIAADLRLEYALESNDAERVEDAAGWFWRDAAVADLVAQAYAVQSLRDVDDPMVPTYEAKSIEWTRSAISYEPDRAYWWSQLGLRQFTFGNYKAAETAAREGIARQAWHAASWRVLYLVAQATDDEDMTDESSSALCELGVLMCDEDPSTSRSG
jgi:hypothetical protein